MAERDTLIYQLAVHFLPKVALRLERLFWDVQQACDATHPIIHHYALKNVIEIMKVIEKPELKSRFIKELIRIEHVVNKTETNISNARYASLFVQVQRLSHIAGRFGESIHQDPFLQSIRLAQSSHTNDCELHAPQLSFWLNGDAAIRQENLVTWMQHLQTLCDTVNIYLALLRDTAEFEQIDMFNGFYQRSLPARMIYHLILIRMSRPEHIVPKMQLGHHGLSIRLCDAYSMREVKESMNADLAICQL